MVLQVGQLVVAKPYQGQVTVACRFENQVAIQSTAVGYVHAGLDVPDEVEIAIHCQLVVMPRVYDVESGERVDREIGEATWYYLYRRVPAVEYRRPLRLPRHRCRH